MELGRVALETLPRVDEATLTVEDAGDREARRPIGMVTKQHLHAALPESPRHSAKGKCTRKRSRFGCGRGSTRVPVGCLETPERSRVPVGVVHRPTLPSATGRLGQGGGRIEVLDEQVGVESLRGRRPDEHPTELIINVAVTKDPETAERTLTSSSKSSSTTVLFKKTSIDNSARAGHRDVGPPPAAGMFTAFSPDSAPLQPLGCD